MRRLLFALVSLSLAACQGVEFAESDTDLASEVAALAADECGSAGSGLLATAEWPMTGGCSTRATQSTRTGPVSPAPAQLTPPATNWSATSSSPVRAGVIAGASTLYAVSDAGDVYRIDSSTGGILGRRSLSAGVLATPSLGANGNLYVGSTTGRVYALSSTDLSSRWTFISTASITQSPLIGADGRVFAGGEDGKVHCISAVGSKVWSFATGGRISGAPTLSRDAGTVYVGSDDGYQYAIDANSGSLLWRTSLSGTPISHSIYHRSGRVVVGAGSDVVALDAVTGVQAWRTTLACKAASLANAQNGTIYVGTDCSGASGRSHSLDAISGAGTRLWSVPTGGAVRSVPIIDALGRIYTVADGYVVSHDNSGRKLWSYTSSATSQSSPAIAVNGSLVFGLDSKQIVSLGVGTNVGTVGASCQRDADCNPQLLCAASYGSRFGLNTSGACVPPSCANGVLDEDEGELDCGGLCGACSGKCTTNCVVGEQVKPRALARLKFSSGAFFRSTQATYQTSASTTETATSDRLRYEDRGDGYGRLALFEGARTNLIVYSEALDQRPSWLCGVYAPPSTCLVTLAATSATSCDLPAPCVSLAANVGTAPDGSTTAEKVSLTPSSREAPRQDFTGPLPRGTLSAWMMRSTAQAASTRPVLNTIPPSFATWSLSSAWRRQSLSVEGGGDSVRLINKGIIYPDLGPATFFAWGWQFEAGFQSSYVPTAGSAVTRAADRLVFEAERIPQWMRDSTWQLDVRPIFASSAAAQGEEFYLVEWTGGALLLRVSSAYSTGAALVLRESDGEHVREVSWNSNQLATITVDALHKRIYLHGDWTGTSDSPVDLHDAPVGHGAVSIGANLLGEKSAFSRISEPRLVSGVRESCRPDSDCNRCGDGFVNGTEVCDTGANSECSPDCSAAQAITVTNDPGECGPGQALGRNNGLHFGLSSDADVCWPSEPCTEHPEDKCGSVHAACGLCFCPSQCEARQCGQSLSDGCGGQCEVPCGPMECGCSADSQCPNGYRCLVEQGWRYGCEIKSNVCAPAACVDSPRDRTLCGYDGAPCGKCPELPPLCAGLSCGENAEGEKCATVCNANESCVGGTCVNTPELDSGDPLVPKPIAPPPPAQTSSIGAVAAQFSVSEAGQAVYSIPVEAPPGFNGVQPQLELRYSSSAGNGYLGLGWTVGGKGLSAIVRCNKNFADDGINSPPSLQESDAYCIDGQRLVEVARSETQVEYRTVPDSFAKVVASLSPGRVLGPASFTVYAKNGNIYEYGAELPGCDREYAPHKCNNSQIVHTNGTAGRFAVMRSWYLSTVRDRAVNQMNVFYSAPGPCTGNGPCGTDEVRPLRIAYSGGGWVRFDYRTSTRLDPVDGYRNGSLTKKTRLLSKLVTGSAFGAYRSYWVDYDTSFDDGTGFPRFQAATVDSVHVCSGDGSSRASLACIRPTSFSYTGGRQGGLSSHPGTLSEKSSSQLSVSLMSLDADGDGRKDLLLRRVFPGYGTSTIYLGWERDPGHPYGSFTRVIELGDALSRMTYNSVDIDNDGDDEILVWDIDEDRRWELQAFSGTGFTEYPVFPEDLDDPLEYPIVYDVDGDGLKDVLVCSDRRATWRFYRHWDSAFQPALEFSPPTLTNGQSAPCPVYAEPSALKTTQPLIIDIDGDGALDLLSTDVEGTGRSSRAYLSKILFRYDGAAGRVDAALQRYEHVNTFGTAVFEAMNLWGDFNGDGYPEPIGYVNTGTNLVKMRDGRPCEGDEKKDWKFIRSVLDFDADGRDDVICSNKVYRAFYDGSFQLVEPLGIAEEKATSAHSVDLDGDGISELVTSNEQLQVRLHQARSQLRKLRDVVDGYGNRIVVGYSTDGDRDEVYQPTSCPFPCGRSSAPVLVSEVSYERSDGSKSATRYKYQGYHRDLQRRSSIGFERGVEFEEASAEQGVRWKITDYEHLPDYAGGYVGAPSHGGRFLFSNRPSREATIYVVGGSSLSGSAQEFWGELKEWAWVRKQSAQGISFAHAQEFRRSTLLGSPLRPITAATDVSDASFAALGITERPDLLRADEVDSYGNRTRSATLWSDGVATVSRARYEATPERVANWLVGLKDRELFYWVLPGEPRTPVGAVRRASFEHSATGFLEAITREPYVANWDYEGLPANVRNELDATRRVHELRTEFRMDAHARTTSYTQIAGGSARETRVDFPPSENLVHAIASYNALGHKTVLDIDRNSGQLRFARYPDGRTVQNGYDLLGRLFVSYEPEGTTTLKLSATDDLDVAVQGQVPLHVDAAYSVTEESGAGERTTSFFNSRSQVVREVTLTPQLEEVATEFERDAAGRVTRSTLPHLVNDGAPGATLAVYDALGRVREIRRPGPAGHERVALHDYARPETLSSDHASLRIAGAHIVHSEVDARGGVRFEVDGLRGQSLASVDESGTVTTFHNGPFDFNEGVVISDASGPLSTVEVGVTAYGWRQRIVDPSIGTHAYTFTRFGEIETHTDAASRVTRTQYDALGRRVRQEDADGTSRWEWDCRKDDAGVCRDPRTESIGKIAWSAGPDGHEIESAYDPDSKQLARETYRIKLDGSSAEFLLDYDYDEFGRLQTLQYPETGGGRLTVRYEYSVDEVSSVYLIGAHNERAAVWQRATAKFGKRESFRFGNGTVSMREYDQFTGEPVLFASWKESDHIVDEEVAGGAVDGRLLSRFDVSYDLNGNVETHRDKRDGFMTRFVYDQNDRLSREYHVEAGLAVEAAAYDYDGLGNIRQKTGVGSYTYDPLRPHVVKTVGTTDFEVDVHGNHVARHGPLAIGSGERLSYTASGMLRSVAASGLSTSYEYNAGGGRAVTKGNGRVVAHVGRMFERIDSGGTRVHRHRVLVDGAPIAEFDMQSSVLASARYFHLDWRGSPALILGGGGEILSAPRYDAYGKLLTAPGGEDVGFTSHRAAEVESRFIDMGGRYYDPVIGRFISADPSIPDARKADAYNRYAYVYGNPLALTDPSGFDVNCDRNPATGERFCMDDQGNEVEPPADPEPEVDAGDQNVEGSEFEFVYDAESERSDSGVDPVGGPDGTAPVSVLTGGVYLAGGLAVGGATTVAMGYLLGGAALVCPLCTAVAAGGMAVYGAYEFFLNGGYEDAVETGERLLSGDGTAGDYYKAGVVLGGFLRAPKIPHAWKAGGRDMAARLRLGIRAGGGGGGPPKGGVYKLKDPATGKTARNGRSKNLARRERDHARSEKTKDLQFKVEHRTDDYATQRGLEQHGLNTDRGPLDKIEGISASNPNLERYMQAAMEFLGL